jgi:hypothetical protein
MEERTYLIPPIQTKKTTKNAIQDMSAYRRSRPGKTFMAENIEENQIFSVEIFHARESDKTSGPKKRRIER